MYVTPTGFYWCDIIIWLSLTCSFWQRLIQRRSAETVPADKVKAEEPVLHESRKSQKGNGILGRAMHCFVV